jgi:putative membrane protein
VKLLIRWVVLAFAFWIATTLLPGIKIHGGVGTYFWVALLFGLINTFIGSLVKLLTLPAVLLSLGLFAFVINAAMLMLTSKWSSALEVKNFGYALLGSLVISVISSFFNRIFASAKWI